MAISEFHFTANNSLGKMTSAVVLTPEKMSGTFPVLYLLHGHSDDHTTWTRRTNIDRYVESLPMIVVMPNGDRGWYQDALLDPSKKFESHIVKDLVPFVDSVFQTVPTAAGRAIAGLSMGGYGAMKLGLKYPQLFGAIHSFSGALAVCHEDRSRSNEEFRLIFGDSPAGTEADPFFLASQLQPNDVPQIVFDCGVDDFLIEHNRKFDQRLNDLAIPHTFIEYPGGHNWTYWNEHILEAIVPILKHFGLSTPFNPTDHLPVSNSLSRH